MKNKAMQEAFAAWYEQDDTDSFAACWEAACAWKAGGQESDNIEGWEPLAIALCEEEGNDPFELIWEHDAIPEPWGDRWMKYEDDAKRMINLVHTHVTRAAPEALPNLCGMPVVVDPSLAPGEIAIRTAPEALGAAKGVTEFRQFLSDVLTAAGLVSHGKQCKALGERLGKACMKYLAASAAKDQS